MLEKGHGVMFRYEIYTDSSVTFVYTSLWKHQLFGSLLITSWMIQRLYGSFLLAILWKNHSSVLSSYSLRCMRTTKFTSVLKLFSVNWTRHLFGSLWAEQWQVHGHCLNVVSCSLMNNWSWSIILIPSATAHSHWGWEYRSLSHTLSEHRSSFGSEARGLNVATLRRREEEKHGKRS